MPDSTAGTSYRNTEEAQLVARVIQQLLSGPDAMQPSDIGVITPYSGQVPSAAYASPTSSPPTPHVCHTLLLLHVHRLFIATFRKHTG